MSVLAHTGHSLAIAAQIAIPVLVVVAVAAAAWRRTPGNARRDTS